MVAPNADGRQVVIQFADAEGNLVGPQMHLHLQVSQAQLQQLLNELRQGEGEDPVPYSFKLKGPAGEVELVTTLEDALGKLKGVTSETVMSVAFYPLATFRVRPITRCTASLEGHSEAILALAFSPDCRTLATGSGDTTVRLWDLATETPYQTLKGHKNWVLSVSWSPCASALASAGMDTAVCVWFVEDVGTYGIRQMVLKGHTKGVTSLAWESLHTMSQSATLPRLASASLDMTIRIWDPVRGVGLQCLTSHTLPVTQIRFSGILEPHRCLFSCSRDTTVKVWDIDTGALIQDLRGHGHWVNTLTLNTELVMQAGAFDHTLESRQQTNHISRAAAAHSRFMAHLKDKCGGRERMVTGSDDCTMFLWEPHHSKKPIARLTGHQRPVNHVQFSPDGRIIASASFDKSIRLWDAVTGQYLGVLRGHVGPVYRLAWAPDSHYVVTASADSTVKVWDVRRKALKEDLPGHADEVYAVDWSIDGARVASGSKDRFLKIWSH